jgi:single-strand DNA-binding protein
MANLTTLAGNLTKDPELRYAADGSASCTFSVAVDRRWKDRQSDEWREEVSFFDVVCWRDLAEHVAMSLAKGARVLLAGRLEQHSWQTPEGAHRSRVELVADDVAASLRFRPVEVPTVPAHDAEAAF